MEVKGPTQLQAETLKPSLWNRVHPGSGWCGVLFQDTLTWCWTFKVFTEHAACCLGSTRVHTVGFVWFCCYGAVFMILISAMCFNLLHIVTQKWFTSKKHSLFALSVACILLPILIQWVFVDRSVKRRVFTLFQIKLVTDAWASFWGGKITQGSCSVAYEFCSAFVN